MGKISVTFDDHEFDRWGMIALEHIQTLMESAIEEANDSVIFWNSLLDIRDYINIAEKFINSESSDEGTEDNQE